MPCADCRARLNAGKSIAAKTAMVAITTNNSTSVYPSRIRQRLELTCCMERETPYLFSVTTQKRKSVCEQGPRADRAEVGTKFSNASPTKSLKIQTLPGKRQKKPKHISVFRLLIKTGGNLLSQNL